MNGQDTVHWNGVGSWKLNGLEQKGRQATTTECEVTYFN